ncbi:DUF4230 domain-containing protein [Microvirga sp. STS02]|uniref:DUF4230 domain-containing protein n=1 Tax=Hymenobacter negativus TaxID=2795026 RepID=UPI0018DC8E76|nr:MULTISPECIES: DUF4230 domain-containing protein [Bacteria]MBH8571404.1 DUF4230 domain-containing protein [Hymenobacter negativus]MBR7211144.1 DUF4230 domain-containing protein [Microvirga sp. STS02]
MNLVRLVRRLLPLLFLVGLGWFLWKKIGPTLADLNPLNTEPKVTVTHNTVLTQVEALGKLELVRYKFKDIVEYRRASRYPLLPDAKVALVVGGEAVGCLDLRKIRPQDVVFEGDSIVRVVLPAPELCSFQVNHDQSRVFSTENGFFQDADLVDQGYKYAEKQVRNAALQAGILAQTQRNAEQILVPMLRTLTGRRVIVGQQLVMPAVGPKQ